MNITINAPIESNRNGFEDATVRRVSRALARFSHRISRVDVTLLDENGPRAGVDKKCQIRLVMPGFGELTTSAKHESQWAAVAQASNQARRMVLARLTRRQARRVRRHQKFFESFRSHFDQMVDV